MTRQSIDRLEWMVWFLVGSCALLFAVTLAGVLYGYALYSS